MGIVQDDNSSSDKLVHRKYHIYATANSHLLPSTWAYMIPRTPDHSISTALWSQENYRREMYNCLPNSFGCKRRPRTVVVPPGSQITQRAAKHMVILLFLLLNSSGRCDWHDARVQRWNGILSPLGWKRSRAANLPIFLLLLCYNQPAHQYKNHSCQYSEPKVVYFADPSILRPKDSVQVEWGMMIDFFI